MPPEYLRRFPWGATFSDPLCGAKRASTFHMTLDEMEACGVEPVPGPILCSVRDPQQRFESEVRWRFNMADGWLGADPAQAAGRMVRECERARRYLKADVFEHCQPQSNYLYRPAAAATTAQLPPGGGVGAGASGGGRDGSGRDDDDGMRSSRSSESSDNSGGDEASRVVAATASSDASNLTTVEAAAQAAAAATAAWEAAWPRGAAVCDYLIADPSAHGALLRALLGKPVAHLNRSNRSTAEGGWAGALDDAQRAWVRRFYARDYADPYIALALRGRVLRRSGRGYAVVESLGHDTAAASSSMSTPSPALRNGAASAAGPERRKGHDRGGSSAGGRGGGAGGASSSASLLAFDSREALFKAATDDDAH